MPIALQIDSYQADVRRIVEDVFRSMLDTQVKHCPEAGSPASGTVTASVHFAGEWKGAVLLQCKPAQAFVFTSRLMAGVKPLRIDADVRDALGELANMLGGNLKSVLPTGVVLSMPSVVDGSDYAVHICGGNASDTVSFASDLGVFWVTLVQVLEKERA